MGNDSPCSSLNIPIHLHRIGSKNDQSFKGTEKLYRRIPPNGFQDQKYIGIKPNGEKIIFVHAFNNDLPKLSVVREKYCHSLQDALYLPDNSEQLLNWGVAEVEVEKINGKQFEHSTILGLIYVLKVIWFPQLLGQENAKVKM
jgi:hypothetical protein